MSNRSPNSTPDPATATKEELIALLMRTLLDIVALEKRIAHLMEPARVMTKLHKTERNKR